LQFAKNIAKGERIMKLTGKQKRYLRSLGNQLKPKVIIGKNCITESVIESTNEALMANELIKCRVLENCEKDRKVVPKELAEKTESALVQILGRTFLLYKPNPKEPEIELPKP
jgi:RNA-binding protein